MGSGYEIAAAIVRCVRAGRSERECWDSTPKELVGWVEIIGRQQAGRDASMLGLLRTAKGKNESVKDLFKKLNDHSGEE
jgi:hypothetical protein